MIDKDITIFIKYLCNITECDDWSFNSYTEMFYLNRRNSLSVESLLQEKEISYYRTNLFISIKSNEILRHMRDDKIDNILK